MIVTSVPYKIALVTDMPMREIKAQLVRYDWQCMEGVAQRHGWDYVGSIMIRTPKTYWVFMPNIAQMLEAIDRQESR